MSLFEILVWEKPVLKWAGGKSRVLPQLVNHFPCNCVRYIEPFIGGGAVYFALKKNIPAIVNDFNGELINLYKVIRDSPNELMLSLDKMTANYSEEYYYSLRSQHLLESIEVASRTVFLNKTGFNGLYRQNLKGEFNVPFGKRAKCPALYDRDNLIAASKKLKLAEIINGDFEEVIDGAQPGDFIYCDPPYEPLSATSSFNSYTGGGFSQADQRRLKDACQKAAERGVFVAVSNSSADFILHLYKDQDVRKIRAKRAINSKGDSRGEIEEVLVLLYDPSLWGTENNFAYNRAL